MNTKKILCSVLIPVCLLAAGCGKQATSEADSTAPETTTTTTAQTTSATTTSATDSTETETTTEAVTTVTTTTATTAATTIGPMFTVTTPAQKAQGGDNGEKHADEPAPDYFNYVFEKDNVTIRLTGAAYQTIAYDFSGTVDKDLAKSFFLLDMNFDGTADLVAPCAIKDKNTTYAVFLWNPAVKKFQEAPILLDNPTVNPEKKLITAIRQLSDTTVMLTGYNWQGEKLESSYIVYADFDKLSLSHKTLADNEMTAKMYETRAELVEQLRNYQS